LKLGIFLRIELDTSLVTFTCGTKIETIFLKTKIENFIKAKKGPIMVST
jgi:hypothetical protein